VALDGADVRCDLRSALTHPQVRSLAVLGRAFAGTVLLHDSQFGADGPGLQAGDDSPERAPERDP
jgi:hypothetical protein